MRLVAPTTPPARQREIAEASEGFLYLIARTGVTGAKMPNLSDYTFIVPTRATPRIQETHITLGHMICQLVDEELFGHSR